MNSARKYARTVLSSSTQDEYDLIISKARLSNRQQYILKESLNRFNYQIAMKLECSPETVKHDLKIAYDKICKVLNYERGNIKSPTDYTRELLENFAC